jgi:formate C-acetyltransferase
VRNLITTYFKLGGIQYHFTVADSEVMREAQKHPEDYQDLIVRIAGFSAYFVDMTPEMQNDIIAREEHRV